MAVDINTWNNLHATGLQADRVLQQNQVERALQLLGSTNPQQRQWAARVLTMPSVRRAVRQLRRFVYNMGQTIAQMKREKATTSPQQAARDLVQLANMFDRKGLYAAADLADHTAWCLADMPEFEKIPSRSSCSERLVVLASVLDVEGKHGLADALDMVMKAAFSLKKKEQKKAPSSIKPGRMTPLSMRYCPDHRGVQVARIAENTYQCPVDGKIYNHETGYVDYQGQAVPGGSIAGQTPDATPVAIPHRIFDTRENTLNALN